MVVPQLDPEYTQNMVMNSYNRRLVEYSPLDIGAMMVRDLQYLREKQKRKGCFVLSLSGILI